MNDKSGIMRVNSQRTWRCFTVTEENLNGVFETDDEKQMQRFVKNVTSKGKTAYVTEYVLIYTQTYPGKPMESRSSKKR